MRHLSDFLLLHLIIVLVLPQGLLAQQPSGLDWSKFDFVPGDEIIFEDDQKGEVNGEFPGKWDLANGTVENAVFENENVIMFIRTNTNSDGGIVPLMSNGYEDYLPDEFTVEFDAYFETHNRGYRILFYDGKNQRQLNRTINPGSSNRNDRVIITQNSVRFGSNTNHYPGFGLNASNDAANSKPGWRRISISFNRRALKVYIDDARVLNIPNMDYNPIGLTFAYHNPTSDHLGYIKNVRVAKGAVPLYDKMLTDGKIVTTGIRFDVNKATLRPESFGVINEVVKLMKDNPELNFRVEGHTDSDGSESSNQTLSEFRAKAVMDEMIKMGISPSRLSFLGHGQSVPIADNSTPEGKAQNRRVEFVAVDKADLPDNPAPEIIAKNPDEGQKSQENAEIGITYRQFMQKVRPLKIPGFSGSPKFDYFPDGGGYIAEFKRGENGTNIMLLKRPPRPEWFGEPNKLAGKDAQFLDHGGLATLTIDLDHINSMMVIGSTTILDKDKLEEIAVASGLLD